MKTSIKKMVAALSEKEVEAVKSTLKEATSSLDRAASKGVIPKGRASRKISRLTAKANKILLPAS